MGSQNGFFGQYLGNRDMDTTLKPYIYRSGLGFLSRSDPKIPKLSPMGSQNGILANILGTEVRERYDLETTAYTWVLYFS